jgi:hypothetical protein
MPKHPSPAQSEASRINGKRSKGPREGKTRSRYNSQKHGMCSTVLPMPGEDPGVYEKELADWNHKFRPADPDARIFAEECARAAVGLRRCHKWHDAMVAYQFEDFLKRRKESGDAALQKHWDLLDSEPILAVDAMLKSSEGCRWMKEAWEVIVKALDAGEPLGETLRDVGMKLLGGPHHGPRVWEFDMLAELYDSHNPSHTFEKYMRDTSVPPSLRKKYPALPSPRKVYRTLKAIALWKQHRLGKVERWHREFGESTAMNKIIPTYLCLGNDADANKYLRYAREHRSALFRAHRELVKLTPSEERYEPEPPADPPEPASPAEPPPDVSVHVGFDESEDVGEFAFPGFADPLSRNEPENAATGCREEVYPPLPDGMIREANGYFVAADGTRIAPHSVPGLWLEKCWARHGC